MVSGLMVSALISGSSSPGSSPGRAHCTVFLDETSSLTVPRCINGYSTVKLNAGANPAMDYRPTQGGVEIQKMGHLTRMQTLSP